MVSASTSAYVGGYLFSVDAIKHLLMKSYGIDERVIASRGALTCAREVFWNRKFLDRPGFVPFGLLDEQFDCPDGWVLGCRLAFGWDGMPAPDVSLNVQVQAYADYWYPQALRGLEEFKDVKYVQFRLLRKIGCANFMVDKARDCTKEKPPLNVRGQVQWLQSEAEKGRFHSYFAPRLLSVLYKEDVENDSGFESGEDVPALSSLWAPRRFLHREPTPLRADDAGPSSLSLLEMIRTASAY
ncbi:uncharacterized protein BXZ73DRAFT_109412 [Epithele typhae]|uniref:uncharacterized protein n=1 Tax=Epithele typhae TaxID=378194 RepID=UPI0020077972|nr:uncharacterized protein BXZ73DRAFT_109412 [Epithele typhae]KAH9910167.1 hypothetical protein BXZ73DRAFT_109412 [Epithele typhae]